MSAYKVIQTEFRNAESLVAALRKVLPAGADLQVARDPRSPSIHLYGYRGDERPELAGIRLPQEVVNHFSGGASNDIGFAWNGSSYQAIVSDWDRGKPGVLQMLDNLRQQYAVAEVRRQAGVKGYTVRETRQANGAIQLTLVRR